MSNGQQRRHVDVATDELGSALERLLGDGYRIALVAAHDDGGVLRIVYLLTTAHPRPLVELTVRIPADQARLPSMARLSFSAGRFEREMHDLFGVVPVDHPLPRRLVRHQHWPAGWYPMRRDAGPPPPFTAADPFPFVTVEGAGVFEIPVGPVHAGLIEPGHFRFSVVGETIIKLKARLWFAHRGVEKLLEGTPPATGVNIAERISGDTSVGHALAYSLAVEDALGLRLPPEGQLLRSALLELERLYNHVADVGALANDVGFGIANAHALRIRERLLRINALVAGHRLLRGTIAPGVATVARLPDPRELTAIADDIEEVCELTLANSVVRDRFTGTAVLTAAQAHDLGCLGLVARASGVAIDARADHPLVELPGLTAQTRTTGDVLARYLLRRDEIQSSVRLLEQLLPELQPGCVRAAAPDRRRQRASGVGITEGWRGTIVHRVEIARDRLTRVKVVDPSWFNWPALPVALADTIVPDFPLVNKSFNLSYAGNDL